MNKQYGRAATGRIKTHTKKKLLVVVCTWLIFFFKLSICHADDDALATFLDICVSRLTFGVCLKYS